MQSGSTAMICYFNPGHETAVLNASKHYQPAANVLRMQQELAFLPVWYAQANDFVWLEKELDPTFLNETNALNPEVKSIIINQLEENRSILSNQSIDLWGISPAAVHRFQQLNEQYKLNWQIPEWKDEFRRLGSRFIAQDVLAHLTNILPAIHKAILPKFVATIEEIENYTNHSREKSLVKSPYSSSGRGLVWLSPGKLPPSERQIISGMLKKQSQVSIEKALDKQLDFSMHFATGNDHQTHFTGYSVFQTNEKGAYKKSLLANQQFLEQQITAYIDPDLLLSVQNELKNIIQKKYTPHYQGNIGVDMLVYQTEGKYHLHPCVEINMRKSMGFLAICLQKNYLYPESKGDFQIDYTSQAGEILKKHKVLKQENPVVMENNRMVSGYLNLCPITGTNRYHAYLIVKSATQRKTFHL